MGIKLSIIIPIYKEEDYIKECLNSVYDEIRDSSSDISLYEVIVVSDGASKVAEDRVLEFKDRFTNFKLLKMEHKGAGGARNLGLSAATGEYVSFIDADDRMSRGFLKVCNKLLEENKDLYIFGLKRIEDEKVECWTVKDKVYGSNHEFADEYIRKGNLLVYSNCNKLYKSKIVRDNNINFNEDVDFGEDRLFNYEYLKHCNTIMTSSTIKHDYLKRNKISQSTRHYDGYFNIALKLHKEKIKCFISLSNGTSEEEKKKFAADDFIKEIEKTCVRFDLHKDEEKENIKLINDIIFEKPDIMNENIGIMIVLGSRNCGYKVEKALELCKDRPYINYIVSGGNIHKSGDATEAEHMAKILERAHVPKDNIYLENKATNTKENLEYSYPIAQDILKNKDMSGHRKIGVLTSGFHLKRVKLIVNRLFKDYIDDTLFFSAFGPLVTFDTWYNSDDGKEFVYSEIHKNINSDFDVYMKFIDS